MLNILIRADSSNKIGLGHVMRDMVLAEQFAAKGHQIHFGCLPLPGNAISTIRKKGFGVIELSTDTIEELVHLLEAQAIDLLIIDHYQIDKEAELGIKAKTGVSIFVVDDLYKPHHCNFLLNHNISGNADRYRELVPQECLVMAGPQYALIRQEFKASVLPQRPIQTDQHLDVFITFGGSDPTQLTPLVIEALKDIEGLHLHVFTTTSNGQLKKLESVIASYDHISLYINEINLADRMNTCDLAIVSPSVTAVETIYMELPLIVVKAVANQQNTFNFLKERDLFTFEPEEIEGLKPIIRSMLDSDQYNAYYQSVKELKAKYFNTQNKSIYELVIAKAND